MLADGGGDLLLYIEARYYFSRDLKEVRSQSGGYLRESIPMRGNNIPAKILRQETVGLVAGGRQQAGQSG